MTKYEKLGNLIGMSNEEVKEYIDEGMIDILIELNQKEYKTIFCCEGHLNENNQWNGYIGFAYPYKFSIYPKNFASTKKRAYYYWDGKGEESRQEFLNGLLKWAELLPVKSPIEKKTYTLYGKNKNRINSKEKILIATDNYEDIKIILNRRDMAKYDLRLIENIIETY